MYPSRAFLETDLVALDALVARDNLATLITVHDGAPVTSHLPMLYRRDGDQVELRGHWSRANPQSRHAGRALAIIHGPHAYVSPSWYPDKEEAARVPTWNYVIANLHGELTLFEDEPGLASVVDDLTRQHEARVGGGWRYEHERDSHRNQLRGIVGFRMAIDRIELKFKLNQNHPVANRAAVADALATQQRESSREVAALMRARLADDVTGD
jgi:transcriptional regulator